MRTFPKVLGVFLLASCAGGNLPNAFSGAASGGGSAALSCVTDRVDELGYRAVSGSANTGFVRLERENDEPFWLNVIGINDSVDVLDASLQGSQLRVAAYSQMLRAGERQSAAPSDEARREARDLVDACT